MHRMEAHKLCAGTLSRKFHTGKSAPYSRLVPRLQHLWDHMRAELVAVTVCRRFSYAPHCKLSGQINRMPRLSDGLTPFGTCCVLCRHPAPRV
jgi:hypothetical protein